MHRHSIELLIDGRKQADQFDIGLLAQQAQRPGAVLAATPRKQNSFPWFHHLNPQRNGLTSDDISACGEPRRIERFHRRKPFFTFRLAGSDHNFIERPAATKGSEFQSPVRQKYGYDTTHCKHIRDLVDYRAKFELLRRHESGRSKHPSHLVSERPVPIMIQVNQTHGLRCKVIDHRAVVEVHSHPSQLRSGAMKVEDDIQSSDQVGKGKSPKSLKWRRRIGSPRAFYTEEFTWDPLIDQHRTMRRLDDVKQLREAVVGDTSTK